MKPGLAALGLAAVLASPGAHAQSFLDVINVSASGRTNGSSNFVSGVGSLDYVVGRLRLNLDTGLRATMSYSYESAEPFVSGSLRSMFLGPGGLSMMVSGAASGTTISTAVESGLLDFGFPSVFRPLTSQVFLRGQGSIISNGSNYAWNSGRVGISLNADGRSGRLLFESGSFGGGDGVDYDDMVVRFNLHVSPVPEAGSMLMLGAGLGVLALAARRRRARAHAVLA
jgi:hypothetical protein